MECSEAHITQENMKESQKIIMVESEALMNCLEIRSRELRKMSATEEPSEASAQPFLSPSPSSSHTDLASSSTEGAEYAGT